MEKYIKDLTTIIRDCNMENTYKMSSRRIEFMSSNYIIKYEVWDTVLTTSETIFITVE